MASADRLSVVRSPVSSGPPPGRGRDVRRPHRGEGHAPRHHLRGRQRQVERTLAKALTEVVIRLDLSGDDAITPEATMEVLQPVIALLQDLSDQDRQALPGLISQFAQEEAETLTGI
ncbi:hypothetical protein [Bailinhaonella thermotolerans]|uniref:hypothetical protein n=1 Tax=Bailinhaonella thermotolerans TaxID=1070861 RepID=UPI00192A4179|nr:hypothetical protein [Bailinhaonella thermotolerans]